MKRVLAIEDENLWRGVVRKGIPQLLRYPCAGWMPSDVAVKNAAPMMSDHEKAIQHAERERWHSEEVHGGDRFSVIVQEGRPSSCRFGIPRGLSHPAQNCALGNLKPQHLQLAVDPRRTPGAVLGDQAKDQLPQLSTRGLPSDNGMFARQPFPVQLEPGAMPSDDSLWPHDNKCTFPSCPASPEQNPEGPIRPGEARTRMVMGQHHELLTER